MAVKATVMCKGSFHICLTQMNNGYDQQNQRTMMKNCFSFFLNRGTFRVRKKKPDLTLRKQPRRRRVLVNCSPLQGLVGSDVVRSLLSFPSAPLRPLCLPRCAAAFVQQQ